MWGGWQGKSSIKKTLHLVQYFRKQQWVRPGWLHHSGGKGSLQAWWHLGTDYERLVMQAECLLLNQLWNYDFFSLWGRAGASIFPSLSPYWVNAGKCHLLTSQVLFRCWRNRMLVLILKSHVYYISPAFLRRDFQPSLTIAFYYSLAVQLKILLKFFLKIKNF